MNMAEPPRKHLRVGHHSERGAINAVRTFLERHDLVVDEVDGRSDYGRDLNVDVTRGSEITGGIIGVQVKGGKSFYRNGRWIIPATPTDWHYWRSSTVPIIGMVHDPATATIRWINLSQHARSKVQIDDSGYDATSQSDDVTEVAVNNALDDKTFDAFLGEVETYLAATAESAYLLLVESDDEARRRGIFNCWTLGRRDPRPLILLRRLLPFMTGGSLLDGITVLAHATPHPDIFWTKQNWITPLIEDEVLAAFRWSPEELATLVHAVETLDEWGVDWQRGGIGQSLWSIMVVDPDLYQKLPGAIRICVEADHLQAALRLVICYQYLADDPVAIVDAIMKEYPSLAAAEAAGWIVEHLHEWGRIDVY
ncbi:Uncharacterised protein [Mycobacteroides abscessus subsp. abscessus]|uniref:DUF4365 domain-containing protein n=1 Tax=Mycobacteroides abscessus TaxID=36809 RepID=UPI000929C1CF|nr:DUF4365 domain-containing protein [Mycobacteroides abscessus]MDM2421333.1 DUF4365 domain-containing protein [Mycobacteroides abscessus]MDM2426424.1 DUF4365 domain-containing protein [Mycobacteroides abscessus]MDM2429157.1 DUF4365 domain-containing protein [Mycobacteroides abscessus]MDM2433904.1 DUF4365 domain-containing protein [Mycobacteroides abscessus]MDM2442156.1 DUF4365 domain-containing protein [Mycobacteroides abscessus]